MSQFSLEQIIQIEINKSYYNFKQEVTKMFASQRIQDKEKFNNIEYEWKSDLDKIDQFLDEYI